jgi:lysine 6-dehydrogenase
MGYDYAVLGAGRQGTACAYDLIRFGEADVVWLADRSREIAEAAAARVNQLLDTQRARGTQLDVRDQAALATFLGRIDALVSAVPYWHNLGITQAAMQAGTHMCDLGGNTDLVRQQWELDAEAQTAGVRIVPDCGQVPGMGTTLMVYAMGLLDEPEEVFMWDGGLPQKPHPPFQYLATFNLAGLTNEFAEPAVFLRDGQPTLVAPMEELEVVEFPPPVGRVEAFTTSGGVSTLPWTFAGKLKTIQNKTIRYPGSFAQLRAFYDLGMWRIDPVTLGDSEVVPRDLFHKLFEPLVTFPGDTDVCAIRIQATGLKDGRPSEAFVEMIDLFDPETGFTAMERTTGFDVAIVAAMAARGQTPVGVVPVELAVPPQAFVDELAKRGIEVQSRVVERVA